MVKYVCDNSRQATKLHYSLISQGYKATLVLNVVTVYSSLTQYRSTNTMSKLITRYEYDQAIARWSSKQRDMYLAKLDRLWLVSGVIVTGDKEIIEDLFQ